MVKVTASTGVKLKGSNDTLSGSTTITGTDNSGKSSTLATIQASGSPTKGGGAFSAGSSNGWTLDVTYNNDGTATGAASGNWSSTSWNPNVYIEVDAPGRSRHKKKVVRKAKAGSRKKAKASTRKSPKKWSAKTGSTTRRKKAARR
jgi:hypothetical protein